MVTKNPRTYQPELGIGYGTAREHDPIDFIREGARRFTESQGRTYSQKGLDTVQVDHQRGHAQFLAYEKGMASPTVPSTEDSYKAMRSELHNQYEFMTSPTDRGGLGIKVEVTDTDPYPEVPGRTTGQQMADDMSANRRIKVWSTASGGTSHALLTDNENDMFRAVHDVFGHLATGRGTSRHGEEAAYLSHAQMFSPQAREALTSETRGQNSYLNYNNRGAGFADQSDRLVSVPQWMTESGPLPLPPAKRAVDRSTQERLF